MSEGELKMIDLAEKIKVECFLCRRILEKMRSDVALTEAEQYHIDVDLAAINRLREHSLSVSTS